MIDLQWDIINIIALAGAAGDPEFLVEDDDDLEEGGVGARDEVDIDSLMESIDTWRQSIVPDRLRDGPPNEEPETREP